MRKTHYSQSEEALGVERGGHPHRTMSTQYRSWEPPPRHGGGGGGEDGAVDGGDGWRSPGARGGRHPREAPNEWQRDYHQRQDHGGGGDSRASTSYDHSHRHGHEGLDAAPPLHAGGVLRQALNPKP